jgi:hypothetical protein
LQLPAAAGVAGGPAGVETGDAGVVLGAGGCVAAGADATGADGVDDGDGLGGRVATGPGTEGCGFLGRVVAGWGVRLAPGGVAARGFAVGPAAGALCRAVGGSPPPPDV